MDMSDVKYAVLISDVHLGCRNASMEWLDNITGYMHDFFVPLLRRTVMNGKTIVIVAGDWYDNRLSIDINVMNRGMDLMREIASVVPVYMITGNHDVYKKNGNDVNSIRYLGLLDGVTVIEQPAVIDFAEMKFLLYPWSGDIKKDTDFISSVDGVDYMIMHDDVKGQTYDNGRKILSGLDAGLFSGRGIYSGHIHKRQENGGVVYIGSPYQLRRSDIGNVCGIYTLDVSGKDVVRTFEPNTFSPVFLKIRLDDVLDMSFETVKGMMSNNYVDFVIRKSELMSVSMPDMMRALDSAGAKKVRVVVEQDIDPAKVDSVSKAVTVDDMIREKINAFDLSDEQKKIILDLNGRYMTAFNEMSINE